MTTQDQWTEVAFVSVGESDDAFVVAFEEIEDKGRALFLMSDLEEPDDQEIKLGMDTYCLVNQDDETHYGGVERVTLDGRSLGLHLLKGAADKLGLPRVVRLELTVDVDEATVAELRGGLRWVLTFGNPLHHPALELGEEPDEPDAPDAQARP
ncbi:Imm10 family immunity protein [Nocardioides sp.]|uniref:Imm10 family immunity protein n=1 Tax=Nocardioides sp. TaxID=35761 RepID=UPI00271C2195|nr:Imm10 family immunity protein [Nocardioides sp.]MDO9456621.1 Imm10 family immunity protein [Nocardioides sp.]